MSVADTPRFDFENGRSVQPKNPCMLCGRISDTGLYSFCYQRIGPKGILLFAEAELGLHLNSRGRFKIGSFYFHGSF